jgi:hypothetical protein
VGTAPAPDIRVVDVPDRLRFDIRVDGEIAGFTDYRRRPGLIAFIRTLTDLRFEGHRPRGPDRGWRDATARRPARRGEPHPAL